MRKKFKSEWRKKMKEPIVFGVPCPHCYTPNQVPGMRCLECSKYVFTRTQIVVMQVVVVLCTIAAIAILGYFSQTVIGMTIISVGFAVAFVVVLKKMKNRRK